MSKTGNVPRALGGGALCLTDVLREIMSEIAVFSPQFAHIDMRRVLVSVAFNKRRARSYLYGKLVPLRFKDGQKKFLYRGCLFEMPDVLWEGIEQLYVIYFYSPHFFNRPPNEKLRTIFHELYHISPEFNGDIRRLGNKKAAHGHSRKNFDTLFEKEAKRFGEYIEHTRFFDFLSFSMKDYKKFKNVTYLKIKTPWPVLLKGKD